jgi:hypothetical protein
MIFWSLCAFIWFRNMKKMLLQMTSVSLQPVPSLNIFVLGISSCPVETIKYLIYCLILLHGCEPNLAI